MKRSLNNKLNDIGKVLIGMAIGGVIAKLFMENQWLAAAIIFVVSLAIAWRMEKNKGKKK